MFHFAPLPYIWMLIGSFAFALMSVLTHLLASPDHGLQAGFDWQIVAMARSGLAFVFAVLLAHLAGAQLVWWRPPVLWVRSLAGSGSLLLNFYALSKLPPSDVLTLSHAFPLWVALLSWPLEGQPPKASVWVCVVLGVVGMAVVQQPHFAQGNLATLAALTGSFLTAVAMLGLHRLHGIATQAVVAHFSGVASLTCLAALFFLDRSTPPHAVFGPVPLLVLLGVGITATIGQIFLTKAFAAGPPAQVSVVGLTQVLFALALDALLGNRSFAPTDLIGIPLVLAPTAWLMTHRGDPPAPDQPAPADLPS